MRIREVLYALAFRGGSRVKKGSDDSRRLRLFTNSILRMFRRNLSIGNDPTQWAQEVHSMLHEPLPLEVVRKAWLKSMGGCGYRDVYDCLNNAASSTDKYSAFLAFATAGRFLTLVVGGKAARAARDALKKALYKHLPYDLEVDTDTLVTIAESRGRTIDTFDKISRYCEIQEYRIRLPKQQINAGIFNHFCHWLSQKADDISAPTAVRSMETQELIDFMMNVENLAREYVDQCDAHYSCANDLKETILYAMELWP